MGECWKDCHFDFDYFGYFDYLDHFVVVAVHAIGIEIVNRLMEVGLGERVDVDTDLP